MNISTYIFGTLDGGYSQYPKDYTQTIFQDIYTNSSAPSQIIVHRNNELIYYVYIRQLGQGKYIGLAVVLNGIMLKNFKKMFTIFEQIFTSIVVKGEILQFNNQGIIISKIKQLYKYQEETSRITDYLRFEFEKLGGGSKKLPPTNYAIAKNEKKYFSIEDNIDDIIKSSYTYGYTFVYKSKNYNTALLNNYSNVLSKLSKELETKNIECDKLKNDVSTLKRKQRNTFWVGILGIIAIVLGTVVWNEVLYPSEVTHYETGEFVYYGPVENNKPHGVGVAIYPIDDKDGRKYYIGNFVNGERQDTAAILFYQDGDYYYGSMKGDNWDEGVLYLNSDNSYFKGSFNKNSPYSGIWYDYKKSYSLKEGKKKN